VATIVSAHLAEHCLLGILRHKTRILITHHVDVAKHADLIIVMDQGRIAQQGSYEALTSVDGTFKNLIDEYGNDSDRSLMEDLEGMPESEKILEDAKSVLVDSASSGQNYGINTGNPATKIHLDEERNMGAVSGRTYMAYLKAMFRGGPFLVAVWAAIMTECIAVALSLMLSFWAASSIPGFGRSHYMGIYAGLGVAIAMFSFLGAYSTSLSGLGASFMMAKKALHAVLRSPVAFHDRTPSGRIVSRLTSDIESLDQRLPGQFYYLFGSILSIFGMIGLVFYAYPYLGIIFAPLFLVYYIIGLIYARTSRQLRRIDSTMRSYVYSAFGEQLAGVVSIRAYRQQKRFVDKFDNAVDDQGRFYYMGIVQRIWLTLRLNILGSALILGIGIFGVCFRNSASPAKLGVILTYSLQTTQMFSMIVVVYTRLERGELPGIHRDLEH
jgi:ATP-binding cassette subfamily C (CFTR/MRP) protein 1